MWHVQPLRVQCNHVIIVKIGLSQVHTPVEVSACGLMQPSTRAVTKLYPLTSIFATNVTTYFLFTRAWGDVMTPHLICRVSLLCGEILPRTEALVRTTTCSSLHRQATATGRDHVCRISH